MPESESESNVNLDLILDFEVPVSVRFGKREMTLGDILKLGSGALIELDRSADDPVELLVNQSLLARGEVVVAEGHYAIRITQVDSTAARIRSLGNEESQLEPREEAR
jgi:flagellar motor switch protein FliN